MCIKYGSNKMLSILGQDYSNQDVVCHSVTHSYPKHPDRLFDLSSAPNLLDTCTLCMHVYQ